MKILYKIIAIASISLVSHIGYAQNITNVDANQEGKAIAITYDLGEKSNISLYISNNWKSPVRVTPEAQCR